MAETATELRTQLAEIDEETTGLQSKLQLLAEERQSVLRRLDAVVYPVLTLPSDITAEIFMHYSFPDITYAFAREARPPLLLASICRTWRGPAHACPGLLLHRQSAHTSPAAGTIILGTCFAKAGSRW
ncbi:hypothetical protein C8J57DRAFT_189206 [Mycena rebaudengoi]|nr:hypothetical protein C8J57DRAFT_189206 [Mycena rebaudengoi]